jgi:hypothetical protein
MTAYSNFEVAARCASAGLKIRRLNVTETAAAPTKIEIVIDLRIIELPSNYA